MGLKTIALISIKKKKVMDSRSGSSWQLNMQNRRICGAESETCYSSAEHDHEREVRDENHLALRARGHAPRSSIAFQIYFNKHEKTLTLAKFKNFCTLGLEPPYILKTLRWYRTHNNISISDIAFDRPGG